MKLQKKLTNQEQVKRSGNALKFQLINKCLFSLATKEGLADPCPSSFSILKTKLSIFTTYIPQGSPLSPILFLLCISGLLEQLQDPEKGTLGFGFVDDTYLVTWGASAAQNCHRLNTAHSQCQRWAEAHGAKFAPTNTNSCTLREASDTHARTSRPPSGSATTEWRLKAKQSRSLGYG